MGDTPYNYDSLTSREGLTANQCSSEDDVYGDCPKESAPEEDKQSLVPTDFSQLDDNYKCLTPSKHEGLQPIEVAKDGSRVWVSKENKDPSAVNANTPEGWTRAYKTTHGFRYLVKVNEYGEQKTRQMQVCFTLDSAGQKKFYAYKSIPDFEEKETVRSELYTQVPGFDDLPPGEVAKIRAQIPDGLTYVTEPKKGRRSIRFLTQGSLDGLEPLLNWFNDPDGYSKKGASVDPKARNYYLFLQSFLNPQIQARNSSFPIVFTDLTDEEASKIIAQLKQVGANYIVTRYKKVSSYMNKISMPNGQFNPTMYKPAKDLDDWLIEKGGFSEKGCHKYTYDTDSRACTLRDALELYIQPMSDMKSAKIDGIMTGGLFTVLGATLSATLLVPDMRQRAITQVKRIGRGVTNIFRRVVGMQAVQEKPWEETFKKLGVFDITEEIDNYLKDPERWKSEHPKGWKDLNFVEVVGSQAEGETQEIKRGLEGKEKSSVVLIGNRGTGKTATAISFMIRARRGDFGPELQKTHFISLAGLGAGTSDDHRMDRLGASKRVAADYLKAVEQASSKGIPMIGFADEVHKLSTIGQYYQNGELVDKGFAEEIKPAMAAGTVKILGATTNQSDEVGQFRKNEAFANRFNQVEQDVRTETDILEVMMHHLPQKEVNEGVKIPETERKTVLKGIIEICHRREGIYAARDPLAMLDHLLKTKKDEGVATLTAADVHRILDDRTTNQVASAAQMATKKFEKLPTPVELAEFEGALLKFPSYERLKVEMRSTFKEQLVKLWKESAEAQEMYSRQGRGVSGFVSDQMAGDFGRTVERHAGPPPVITPSRADSATPASSDRTVDPKAPKKSGVVTPKRHREASVFLGRQLGPQWVSAGEEMQENLIKDFWKRYDDRSRLGYRKLGLLKPEEFLEQVYVPVFLQRGQPKLVERTQVETPRDYTEVTGSPTFTDTEVADMSLLIQPTPRPLQSKVDGNGTGNGTHGGQRRVEGGTRRDGLVSQADVEVYCRRVISDFSRITPADQRAFSDAVRRGWVVVAPGDKAAFVDGGWNELETRIPTRFIEERARERGMTLRGMEGRVRDTERERGSAGRVGEEGRRHSESSVSRSVRP